jgi:N-acyl-D-aspartate/D-glutamate deacylase
MRRNRAFITLLIGLFAAPVAVHRAAAQKGEPVAVDLLIAGGTVVDGSGGKPRTADVGIRGDRIVFVGNAARASLKPARTLDAAGLIVAPGFVDPHTHTAEYLGTPERRANINYLMQGVTTVITGNDGGGPVRTGELLARWQQGGIGTNAALLVGHGAVRREILGPGDVQPTPGQLEQMKALVQRALDEGALGLSSGLFYVPGQFARTEEVIELARVAAAAGGVYDTHQRDESNYSIGVLASIEEALRIGREAKIHVNISHLKMLGPDVWGKSADAVRIILKARQEGVSVTADQYPYTASGSGLTASLLPPWAQAGAREEQLARLKDPGVRARLVADMEANLKRRGGPESLLLTSSNSPYLGKTLGAIASEHHQGPVEQAIEMITEAWEGRGGGLSVASFNMNEKDIALLMKQDFVMTGSDGSAGHPRLYGTYPRKLREYVYRQKVISLQRFVQASSAQPAAAFHIKDRGQIREGWFADVAVFDPATIADRSTYEKPTELAVGMRFVVVNGTLAVANGNPTNALAGRPVRRGR